MGLSDVAGLRTCDVYGTSNLSPSQHRCLTIAMELVNRPSLVLLEEPTAGLYWHDTEEVAACIQNLAAGGRTVIATTTGLTSMVQHAYKDILLLGGHGGYMMYRGPSDQIASYFDSIGRYVCMLVF
jgi:ABC-type multidrug transport system ATPase subunit